MNLIVLIFIIIIVGCYFNKIGLSIFIAALTSALIYYKSQRKSTNNTIRQDTSDSVSKSFVVFAVDFILGPYNTEIGNTNISPQAVSDSIVKLTHEIAGETSTDDYVRNTNNRTAAQILIDSATMHKTNNANDAYELMLNNNYNGKGIDNYNNKSGMESSPDESLEVVQQADKKEVVQQADKRDFDIAMYNNEVNIKAIHGEMGFPADTKICNRMKYMGLQAQLSKNIRADWNVRKLQPYVEEELRSGETEYEWWANDALEDQM